MHAQMSTDEPNRQQGHCLESDSAALPVLRALPQVNSQNNVKAQASPKCLLIRDHLYWNVERASRSRRAAPT